ncbi:MAG: BrnT family toxin [Rhodoplanes sp.]|jgi:uncharacterized protein|nr:BrnT family toxin [Rhodoplanes sp.]
MPDFSRVIGFEWDEGNSRKNVDKHGVSQSEAEQIFLDPRLLVLVDDRHSGAEKRFASYGRTVERRRLHVNFMLRSEDTLIRVISARATSRRERARYDQET